MTYAVIFTDDEVMSQFNGIPESTRAELAKHFQAIHSAASLRKLPYPAHRNRGVTVRFEDSESRTSLHVARDERRNIEILGVIYSPKDTRRAYDFEVIRDVACPHCEQAAGAPCRLPSGEKADHPHELRCHAYMGSTISEGLPWRLTSAEIVETLCGSLQTAPEWGRFFERYTGSHADQKTGRMLLVGAAHLARRRAPEKRWMCRDFSAFVFEKVSGPYVSPAPVCIEWVRRDFGTHRITEQQMRFYLSGTNPVEYAKKIGAVFMPLPNGMILAVEDPSVLGA